VTIGLFVEYLLDARYEWVRVCLERFGEVPQQVFHEGNSVAHSVEYEGDPRRRPLDYDEIQALFDAADARPGRISGQGRKGALCALRDAAVLKTVYAFGTRRTESSRLDLVDLRRNRKAPQFGSFGSVMVRFGKAQKGSPPKRRTVLAAEVSSDTACWRVLTPPGTCRCRGCWFASTPLPRPTGVRLSAAL
jgi:integrase/recombinase XerC